MIQWYLARPCIISGQDARTTRNFGIFFKLEVSYYRLGCSRQRCEAMELNPILTVRYQ
jgi:hypothetical protein